MRKVQVAPDVEARVIARGTPGFSGADLANLVNEAALLAARAGKRLVTMIDFESAKDKVLMGVERRSMVMSEDEKRLTAYHEAGHTLVALNVPSHDPLHKVTIIPRGRALGVTISLPERDRLSYSKVDLLSRLTVAFGGRIAEELVFGAANVTTGAGNDIRMATEMARRMVTEFGFSDKLGPLRYADNQEEVFLGHSLTHQKHVSDATARLIDEEVRRLIDDAEERARGILRERLKDLDRLAAALLEYETLSGDEVGAVLRGDPIVRGEPSEPAGEGGRRSSVPKTGMKTGADEPRSKLEPRPQPGQ
jgi:cell division protease FtsH